MKNTLWGTLVAGTLLALGAVGCAPLQQTSGDGGYYEPDARVSNVPTRIYAEDPYHPGRQILMERDPFTGRYYPVAGAYGSGYNVPYGSTYDPYYGRGYNTYPRPRYRNRDVYRSPQTAPVRPQQREPIRQQNDQRRRDATNDILGRH